MKTHKKIEEMEKIGKEYNNLIEAIENTQNAMLFDCKYTSDGVEFNFKDNNSHKYINIIVRGDK
jgi:small nuclear ribonucleoprotein (snRNP)-like protein